MLQRTLKNLMWYLLLGLANTEEFNEYRDDSYCSSRYRRLCLGKGVHVACQFPDPGPSDYCENYTQIQFGLDLRNFVIHYINRRRQRVASGHERVRGGAHIPKPSIMTYVEWDRELALLAQRLADQCSFRHDECRATVKYPYAGQTVGEVRWRRANNNDDSLTAQRAIRRVLDAWWGEKRRVELKQLTAPFSVTTRGIVWGHFSQLIVWPLRAVGCGAVRHGANFPRLLLVCDFSHTNMLGQNTINLGPLQPCPHNTARKIHASFPMLCAPIRLLSHTESVAYSADNDEEDDKSDWEYETGIDEVPLQNEPTHRMITVFYRHTEEPGRIHTQTTMPVNIPGDIESNIYPKKPNPIVSEEYFEDANKLPALNYRFQTSEIPIDLGATGIFLREHPQDLLINRRRWKHTRHRPLRPGIFALLSSKPQVFAVTQTKAPSFLKLDREDVDQLFLDTGFKPGWKQ